MPAINNLLMASHKQNIRRYLSHINCRASCIKLKTTPSLYSTHRGKKSRLTIKRLPYLHLQTKNFSLAA